MNFTLKHDALHLSHEQLCDRLLPPGLSGEANDSRGGPYESEARQVTAAIEEHLHSCASCSAELALLQVSLGNFAAATTGYADQQLGLLRITSPRSAVTLPRTRVLRPLVWATAALLIAATGLGTSFSTSLGNRLGSRASLLFHPAGTQGAGEQRQQPARESDEALLEEVDQALDSSIPSALQPLADPLTAQTQDAYTTRSGKQNAHE